MKSYFNQTRFVKSITDVNEIPHPNLPEIAFAGRSNVGKSSLLNAITHRKHIAKISSKPGKTRLINYFEVSESFYFVDLPGYGYAGVSNKDKEKWKRLIEAYIVNNKRLRLICLLMDSRHEMQSSDEQMSRWLDFLNIPYVIVLTKTDKLSGNQLTKQRKYYEQIYPDHHIIPFSCKKEAMIAELTAFIFDYVQA
ncbi:MAG: YihA family ribosome biogenesis GTP-binding protein [Caldithrix sp.]|nr:YihA family ribosome biogenesis GTP-binding protein [Caldithrix sp.]